MTTQLAGRSHMSSSVNNKSFLWWIYFEPLINFGIFPFFLWSPAALESLRMLLPHGSRMSSSQNGKCFFSWILFTKWFLAYFFFRSPAAFKTLRTLLAHGSHMSASMNNKRWGCCCLMGPACHPLRTINVSFLRFFTNWFLVYFFFRYPTAFKTLTTLLAHGSRCQPPRTRNMWYLDYFADNKQCISLWAIANG